MKKYKVNYEHVNGYPMYLVPLVRSENEVGPRIPKNIGVTCYYPTNKRDWAVVAASRGADSYLSKRMYAQKIGVAQYDPNGFDHHNFVL